MVMRLYNLIDSWWIIAVSDKDTRLSFRIGFDNKNRAYIIMSSTAAVTRSRETGKLMAS